MMESTKPASAKVPKGDLKNSVLLAAPIDFSFKCLSAITTEILEYEYPRDGVKKLKQTKDGKYHSATLKLNNNLLATLKGLDEFVSRAMHQPDALMWLDLSFNYICSIDEIVLQQFENLKILYLHGNSIDRLDEIDKLRRLECLRSVTLHGNPVEIETTYKQYVISTLPHISILDFCTIIRSDRVTARCISSFNDFHSARKPARRKHTKTSSSLSS